MLGADPAALRQLAATIDGFAGDLASLAGRLSATVADALWHGLDAHELAEHWDTGGRAALINAAESLHRAGVVLRCNADQQDQASSADSLGAGSVNGAVYRRLDGQDDGAPDREPNPKTTWDLGWQWLEGSREGCTGGEKAGPNGSCYVTEYFSDGDNFTELIQQLPHVEEARTAIAQALARGELSGTYHNHNKDLNILEKAFQYQQDIIGAATWGAVGSPEPAFFLGSYDLYWTVTGVDANGTPIVEFHMVNATTQASGSLDPGKLLHYSAGGLAGDGNDAQSGEKWLQQDVLWREPIGAWVPPPTPSPTPSPGSVTVPPPVVATPHPTPGPQPTPPR